MQVANGAGACPGAIGQVFPTAVVNMVMSMRSFEILVDDVEQSMLRLTAPGDDTTSTAASYHLSSGGRRVRCRLALDAGRRLGLDDASSVAIAATCELLHNASLIHDDLQDGDCMRRGAQSVWAKFGKDVALCVGDLFVSAAYASLAGVKNTELAPLMRASHLAVSRVIHGQIADLCDLPSAIDGYLETISGKSGALLCLPLELCFIAGRRNGALDAARHAVDAFAVAYQISDDLGDWRADIENGRMNIVAVLEHNAAVGREIAIQRARQMAFEHLDLSEELALRFPEGCGRLIAHYACEMRDALASKDAA